MASEVKPMNPILDQSRPRLTMTTIGIVDLQGAGENYGTVGRRRRGKRHVRRQREKKKCKRLGPRVGTLNVGTMRGKAKEFVDMMQRRKMDILCDQETWWKGGKARNSGARVKV